MILSDLKVVNASVRVSNENEESRVYDIAANFQTSDGVLNRVESGQVNKDGTLKASFWKEMRDNGSTSITYYNAAHEDVSTQCEINALIDEFIELSVQKALAEVND